MIRVGTELMRTCDFLRNINVTARLIVNFHRLNKTFSWRRSEHTDRNVEISKGSSQTHITQWCCRKPTFSRFYIKLTCCNFDDGIKHLFEIFLSEVMITGVWFDKIKIICKKMSSGPGSPFGLQHKAPWTSRMFNFWRIYTLSTSPQTRNSRFGHNTGYFFLSLVATSLLSRIFWAKNP